MLCFQINKSFGYETLEFKKTNPNYIKCPSSEILSLTDLKYLFIGEDHRDIKSKKFIIEQIKNFEKLNFETIFVEYIESKDQKIADQFNLNPELYRESLFRTYGLPGDWGYDPEGYLLLTDAIGASGFKIFGLDRRSDLRKSMGLDKQMSIRDQHMFDVVLKYVLKNPNQKIIFLNGSSHSYINKNLTAPSFYELFTSYFKDLKSEILNIKIDYFEAGSISQERLDFSEFLKNPLNRSSEETIDLNLKCPDDSFILFQKNEAEFDYYVFPKTKDILPIHDIPKTSVI